MEEVEILDYGFVSTSETLDERLSGLSCEFIHRWKNRLGRRGGGVICFRSNLEESEQGGYGYVEGVHISGGLEDYGFVSTSET